MGDRPEIVLVRHGETEWSRDGKHTGRTDVPLTDKGKEQARLLAKRLQEWRFGRVLSSPLSRARETCELAGLGVLMEITDELMEWDYGAYEGRTTPDIRTERPQWSLWRDGTPEGENAADVGARVDRIIEDVRASEDDVALFAHGHVLRVFTARWLGLPPAEGRLFALSTATISVLAYERETPVIERWNDDAHFR
jgi:broad specificity phosphatase PhoE